jgi:hexosaminidase
VLVAAKALAKAEMVAVPSGGDAWKGAMDDAIDLLPRPRRLKREAGGLALAADGSLPEGAGPDVRLAADVPGIGPEGYRLRVAPGGVVIEARDAAGAFYAKATLAQLVRLHASSGRIPALTIDDAPDFAERGVMLDVSRDKIPTMATLRRLIDELASLKINRLQLYFEHAFAYREHPIVWKHASPLTGDEVEALDAYCRARFIELVPNQNSFGHMERWLKHPEYAHLAEVVPPVSETMSLCPVDPRAVELLSGLYDDLLPHFSSRAFNVGCDETVDLGKGRSREAVERLGRGRVYLEFVQKIHALVAARGRRMQLWGDIVLEHPELIGELPRDVVALLWGYEADHPFDAQAQAFASAGIEYQVCPGTSAWLSLGGRTTNAVGNLDAAARAGLAHGASGLLITDWGDYGHWQPLPVSFLGVAHGAAVAWCHEANHGVDVASALSAHLFLDSAASMGAIARDLGDVYRETGVLVKNASVLALLMLFPERPLGEGRLSGLTVDGLERAEARAAEIAAKLRDARSDRDDAPLLRDELALAADMMRHGCRLGIARLTAKGGGVPSIPAAARAALAEDLTRILAEHRRTWLLRNREGGLADSAARFESLLHLY